MPTHSPIAMRARRRQGAGSVAMANTRAVNAAHDGPTSTDSVSRTAQCHPVDETRRRIPAAPSTPTMWPPSAIATVRNDPNRHSAQPSPPTTRGSSVR